MLFQLTINILRYLDLFTTWAIQTSGYLGIIVTMALESFMVPIPSELILPLGGYLAATGKLNVLGVAIAGSIGGTLGSLGLYYLSMFFGNSFIKRWGKYLFISEKYIDLVEDWFKKYGSFTVFVVRLLPVIRGFISIPAGIAKMNVQKFTFYTFFGTLIWSLVLTYFGFQMRLSNVGTHVIWEVIFVIIGITIVIYSGFHLVKRHTKTFNILTMISLWAIFAFFVSYAIYKSYSPIDASEVNYSSLLKLRSLRIDQRFSFYVVGNTFSNPTVLDYLTSSSTSVSFILDLGNMVYSGDRANYKVLINKIKRIKEPFIAIPGSRDLSDEGYGNYRQTFGSYDYSAGVGNTFFIMMDDANGELSDQQLNWLSNELRYSSMYSHRIVAMNVPPSWMGVEGMKLERDVSEKLKKILETHSVDLMISTGSKPTTGLSSSIRYALVGGDGYLKVTVDGARIFVETRELNSSKSKFERTMEAVSIYLYSLLILQWPSIGIIGSGILIIWFLWERYKIIFEIEKKEDTKK